MRTVAGMITLQKSYLTETSTLRDTLSHAEHVNKDEMCANVRENTRYEGVLFTSVGNSGSPSTVNETSCNKKRFEQKKLRAYFQLHSDSYHHEKVEMKANIAILKVDQLERWTSNLLRNFLVLVVFVYVDLDGWALQLVLLIRCASDFFIMTAAL